MINNGFGIDWHEKAPNIQNAFPILAQDGYYFDWPENLEAQKPKVFSHDSRNKREFNFSFPSLTKNYMDGYRVIVTDRCPELKLTILVESFASKAIKVNQEFRLEKPGSFYGKKIKYLNEIGNDEKGIIIYYTSLQKIYIKMTPHKHFDVAFVENDQKINAYHLMFPCVPMEGGFTKEMLKSYRIQNSTENVAEPPRVSPEINSNSFVPQDPISKNLEDDNREKFFGDQEVEKNEQSHSSFPASADFPNFFDSGDSEKSSEKRKFEELDEVERVIKKRKAAAEKNRRLLHPEFSIENNKISFKFNYAQKDLKNVISECSFVLDLEDYQIYFFNPDRKKFKTFAPDIPDSLKTEVEKINKNGRRILEDQKQIFMPIIVKTTTQLTIEFEILKHIFTLDIEPCTQQFCIKICDEDGSFWESKPTVPFPFCHTSNTRKPSAKRF